MRTVRGPRSHPARLISALMLALHLFLVGVGSTLDAKLEAESIASAGVLEHFEDPAAADCGVRYHDHRYCLVCRSLAGLDLPPVTCVGPILTDFVPPPAVSGIPAPVRFVSSGVGARAPPFI